MKNIFNSIALMKPKRNLIDLTHDVKLSGNMGELIPIMIMDVVPGDRVSLSGQSLIRFAPMVAPVMHRMDVTMHYFFVPNRILWDNWEKYITNTKLETTGLLPAFPFLTYSGTVDPTPAANESMQRLANYLGIPRWTDVPTADFPRAVSALPFAAYQAIFNEYYRDQNLYPEIEYKLIDGENDWTKIGYLRRRAWQHDYFTSCLPFAQKGDSVDIPLGKVMLDMDAVGTPNVIKELDYTTNSNLSDLRINPGDGQLMGQDGAFSRKQVIDPNGAWEVEPTTINDLRRAFKLQEWLERNARGGTRYIESILSHFGVKSSDKRLQRPEYIVGSKSPVVISEVLNTTGTEDLPQGNMSGHGIAVNSGKFGTYYAEEHGYVIGIMSVMPQTSYFQGIPRHFLKIDDPTQFYWPSFAHIGEQEVKREELFAYNEDSDEIFGYLPRYAEYKYIPSRVCGEFANTLDYWHLARKFDTTPQLSSEFIECRPTDRIFAVTDPDEQKLFCHVINNVKALRPMPKFGTPQF